MEEVDVAGAMLARYWITFFVFSVFPAPDSPLSLYQHRAFPNSTESTHVTRMDWFSFISSMFLKAKSVVAKIWGSGSSRERFLYMLMCSAL